MWHFNKERVFGKGSRLARRVGYEDFSAIVREKAKESPSAAEAIMERLGGNEWTAYLTKSQSNSSTGIP